MADSLTELPEGPLATELRHLITSAAQQCLPTPRYPYSNEFLTESVSAELLDVGPTRDTAPSAQLIASKFAELILDYYSADMDDVDDFATKLSAGLDQIQQKIELQQAADDVFGGCAMCERDMPLTKHHLIPREHHKDFKRKGTVREQLNGSIMICRPCHSAIHRTLDNKELATTYNTLEKLMEVDALQKFAAWASKQRLVKTSDVVNVVRFRYQR